MDSKRKQKDINRLSPIKHNENSTIALTEASRNSPQNTNRYNKYNKTSYLTTGGRASGNSIGISGSPNKTTSIPFQMISVPKNINEYKHMFTNQLVQGDLDWTLGLRCVTTDPNKPKTSHQSTQVSPPTFYEEDLAKFSAKAHLPKDNPFLVTDNQFKLYHLVQDKAAHGLNKSQLNYETTLREFKLKKPGKTIMNHSEKWNGIPFNLKTSRRKFLPPLVQRSKDNLAKIDKYLLKEYVPQYSKITYGNDRILKKKVELSKEITKDFYGDHYSMKKYSENYGQKNMTSIRHILQAHGNTLSSFELGLRSYEKKDTKGNNNIKKEEKKGDDKLNHNPKTKGAS